MGQLEFEGGEFGCRSRLQAVRLQAARSRLQL